MGFQPDQAIAQWILDLGIARGHKVDEFAHACFARARAGPVFGNDELSQTFHGSIFCGSKEQRRIFSSPARDRRRGFVLAGKGPPLESWESRRHRRHTQHSDYIPPFWILSRHLGLLLLK